MRYVFALPFIFLFTSFGFRHQKTFVPPGTVKINDTLYADETEISNLSWYEYVYWTKVKYGIGSKEHLATLPDSMVWNEEVRIKQYPTHMAYFRMYKDNPVVGISYEQAQAFCQWRSDRVKEYMWIAKKYPLIDFTYRLPSKAEWELLSNNGAGVMNRANTFTHQYDKKKDSHTYRLNFHANCIFNDSVPFIKGPEPVTSYDPNYFGLRNMIGNVREMVQEKPICKGGGWKNSLEECRVGKDQLYQNPANDLGFRCVCVVRRKCS
jgi:formylglycine-generating enzyme required for sulfatase activity